MIRRKCTLAALTLALAGCTIATVTTPNVAYGIENSFTSHRFLWGLVGGDVNTGYEAIARVRVYTGVGDFLARLFTVGLYWPYSVDIWPANRVSSGGGGGVFVQQGSQQAAAPSPAPSSGRQGPESGTYCSGCGARLTLDAQFCRSCGRESR